MARMSGLHIVYSGLCEVKFISMKWADVIESEYLLSDRTQRLSYLLAMIIKFYL